MIVIRIGFCPLRSCPAEKVGQKKEFVSLILKQTVLHYHRTLLDFCNKLEYTFLYRTVEAKITFFEKIDILCYFDDMHNTMRHLFETRLRRGL